MTFYLKNARKVTVTLPHDLVVYADSQAERSGTSRSQVITQALAYHMAAEEERLAAEGYAFYAAEAEEFAAGAASATAEAWPAEPQNEERP
jgi:metal-responsive CopG/Arc/MetJ family transcriptional regulator